MKLQVETSIRITDPFSLSLYKTPLSLSSTSLHQVFAPQDKVIKDILGNYIADALLISPLVLGSVDLLGNPTHLIRNITLGLQDIMNLPSYSLGLTSFFMHISQGLLVSIGGFSESLGRNLSNITNESKSQGGVFYGGKLNTFEEIYSDKIYFLCSGWR